MRDLDTLTFHPITEKITKLICTTFQNDNPMFFRILLSFHLTKMAAMMRVNVESEDMGSIPVNMYAINLAPSGQGKGKATNLIEESIINQFTSVFLTQTYPAVVDMNLAQLAIERAQINGDDIDLVEQAMRREFDSLGVYNTTFDSGSVEGIKEIRHKLLMGGIGSINMEVDEVAKNLSKNADLLGVMLELYDVGKVKGKLTKNAKDNIRREEIPGRTPTNLLMFGTGSALMDGSKVEAEIVSWFETGYARRCIFGYCKENTRNMELTAAEIYKAKTDKSVAGFIKSLSAKFAALANIANYGKTITMSEKVSILLIEYQLDCEKRAILMGEHEAIEQAELSHRYFKVLKLAGGYAFIDGQSEVTEDNLYHAICMAEESGKAFNAIMKQDKNYVKLGKYIASTYREVTLVDLEQDLTFFKGAKQAKEEMIKMAVIWGYKNHVIIKRTFQNEIEFITGETLKKVDLENMIISYSNDITTNYRNAMAPFSKLHKLMTKPGLNWVNHHTVKGYREAKSIIPGCNMIVLDVDDGTTVKNAAMLLKEYKFLIYTTKRHTAALNRFRIIMPLNYSVSLAPDEFKEFMRNIYEWLPFGVDTVACDIARKWLTCNGAHQYNEGKELLDARLFIPKTALNDERKAAVQSLQSLNNLERWFVQKSPERGRNNQLLKYAMILVDMGVTPTDIETRVIDLNSKLATPLEEKEIKDTIIITAAKKAYDLMAQKAA